MALLARLRWRLKMLRAALTLPPIAGAEDPEPEPDPAKETKPDPEPEPEKIEKDDDWEVKAKKHARALERERKKLAELQSELEQRKEADKSEQEKALDKAREEGRAEAKTESQQEIRTERLQAAVARLAAGKFADVEDAIALLDTDDAVFDDEGKVNTDALKEALDELLERKPHLKAGPSSPGDPDAGKGTPAPALEELSVEDHLNQIRRYKD